jgi:hypothetical protein
MEPLNLMVSLSHFANQKPKNKRGLSERVGRGRRGEERPQPERAHGWWRSRLQGVARIATR